MDRHHLVNGIKVPFTPEEEASRDLEEQQWAKEQAHYEAFLSYKDKRKEAYPLIEDQLDMIWHAMNDGMLPFNNDFYRAIKAVKDANPKPTQN